MVLFNPFSFYRLGNALAPLLRADCGNTRRELLAELEAARHELNMLIGGTSLQLKVCQVEAQKLYDMVNEWYVEALSEWGHAQIDGPELSEMHELIRGFEAVLEADLRNGNTFVVSQKLAFSTEDLIGMGEKLLPTEVRADLDGLQNDDIRQAARCLAFDVPTAAGFHIARATEGVLHRYYEKIIGPLPQNGMDRTWGKLVHNLQKANTDPKIIDNLRQVVNNHRNPMIHPYVSLSRAEAEVLITVCVGVMTQMLLDMKQRFLVP